jgi:phosphoribosylanthranilate isomerase
LDTRIKICGITRVEDALAALDAGADMLGLQLTPVSPRLVDTAAAAEITRVIGGRATRVGIFVDQDHETVSSLLDQIELDLLQFHGNEPADFCRSFSKPYMKVFRVAEKFDAHKACEDYPDASALLLDAYVDGVPGGTGQRLNPDFWPQTSPLPLILAGGLNPENVGAALALLKPYGVDVSGGVEGDTKGIKDHQKMVRFVRAVKGER